MQKEAYIANNKEWLRVIRSFYEPSPYDYATLTAVASLDEMLPRIINHLLPPYLVRPGHVVDAGHGGRSLPLLLLGGVGGAGLAHVVLAVHHDAGEVGPGLVGLEHGPAQAEQVVGSPKNLTTPQAPTRSRYLITLQYSKACFG